MIRLRSSEALESLELSDDDEVPITSNRRGLDALEGLDEPRRRKRRQPGAEASRPPQPIVAGKGVRDPRDNKIVSKLMHAGKKLEAAETRLKQEQHQHNTKKQIFNMSVAVKKRRLMGH